MNIAEFNCIKIALGISQLQISANNQIIKI
jgi:hypothetical protein